MTVLFPSITLINILKQLEKLFRKGSLSMIAPKECLVLVVKKLTDK